jgi:hypothetical protein
MTREKGIDTRLAAFREATGSDPEAYVAAWREGSLENTPENRRRAEAEALWREVGRLEPGQPRRR